MTSMLRTLVRWKLALAAGLLVAGVASAGLLSKLTSIRLVTTTVNRLRVTILPPGEANPSNMAVVDGDMMMANMRDQPAAHMVHAAEAHGFATGRGVLVAVLDAGFDLRHPVLAGRVEPFGYDAIDGDGDPQDLGNGFDDYGEGTPDGAVGHGTFVAGMILLAAPDARILPVRIMDDEGYGDNGSIVRGIDFALRMGAQVINISAQSAALGDWSVMNKLEEAHARGVVVVASAGNDGRDRMGGIAGHATTISVGATDDRSVEARFSNRAGWGEELVVHAPGVDLVGPMTGDGMGIWSGTSFSAGFATGGAALFLERRPGARPQEVGDAIRMASSPAFDDRGTPLRAGLIDLHQVASR
jgi:subtilisin family serine protease